MKAPFTEFKRFILASIYTIVFCSIFYIIYRETSIGFYYDTLMSSISLSFIFILVILLPLLFIYGVLHLMKAPKPVLRTIIYYALNIIIILIFF